MKIAVVQINVAFADPERNFSKVEKFIGEGAKEGADVLVFPEMWNAGYALKELGRLADENGERTKELFSRLAKKYHVNICIYLVVQF